MFTPAPLDSLCNQAERLRESNQMETKVITPIDHEPDMNIPYRIMATGEIRWLLTKQSAISIQHGHCYVRVSGDTLAELDLTRPDLGWVVYPD